MSWRLLDILPEGGAEYFNFDPDTNIATVRRVVDVEPRIEANKKLQTHTDGYTPSRDLRRVASIPNAIIHKWLVEEGIDIHDRNHWPAIKRKLNSSDWRWLRTSEGQI
jgi:hypothetical protein